MTRLFVTTGAESSGKTTLARQLGDALQAPLVSEASRDYLGALYARRPGQRYTESDLLDIARLQLAREQEALRSAPSYVICDTDLLVIVIWSEVVFGRCAPALLQLFEDSLAGAPRHYLLCDWNGIAWEPDPLRENPHDRHLLYARYGERLEALGLPYRTVGGPESARLRQALDFVARPAPARIRPVVRSDIPALMRIRAAVKENVLVSTVLTEQHYRDALECDGHGFVAEVNGEVVAFTLGNAANGNVWALFVDPRHERQGFGRRLLEALMQRFASRNVATAWLTTGAGTRAERFYREAGWQHTATTARGELRFELKPG